eukprot:TRINITY_DN7153_c0_g1_i1.p1 TRINITY_DN7153_c0_g1~~TRINITY_DN7153_c0_g1_i1.p1  ORF type:complete len:113 (-),score=32.25 TRINITY_DN7153_c0_g1_i1:171-509(-)
MVKPKQPKEETMAELLKPFHARAALAEEKLAIFEAWLIQSRGHPDDIVESLKELKAKMERVKAEQAAERLKAQKDQEKLERENMKLHYRVSHLLRALNEAELKLVTSLPTST